MRHSLTCTLHTGTQSAELPSPPVINFYDTSSGTPYREHVLVGYMRSSNALPYDQKVDNRKLYEEFTQIKCLPVSIDLSSYGKRSPIFDTFSKRS